MNAYLNLAIGLYRRLGALGSSSRLSLTVLTLAVFAVFRIASSSPASAQSCPNSHPIDCGQHCCPSGSTCTNTGCQSESCPSSHPVNCGEHCCPSGTTCTSTGCESAGCPSSHPVDCGEHCCPSGTSCTASGCEDTSSGCSSGDVRCGNGCMPAGEVCCQSVGYQGYCPSGTTCTDDGRCSDGSSGDDGSTGGSGADVCSCDINQDGARGNQHFCVEGRGSSCDPEADDFFCGPTNVRWSACSRSSLKACCYSATTGLHTFSYSDCTSPQCSGEEFRQRCDQVRGEVVACSSVGGGSTGSSGSSGGYEDDYGSDQACSSTGDSIPFGVVSVVVLLGLGAFVRSRRRHGRTRQSS